MRTWVAALSFIMGCASAAGSQVAFSNEQVVDGSLGGASSVSYGDLNGDGHLDLIATGAGTRWYAGDGNGGFGSGNIIDSTTAAAATAIADLNDDGKLDVAIAADTQVLAYLNNGTGTFLLKDTVDTGVGIADVEVADLNNDGQLDIINCRQTISGGVAQGVYWFENNGTGSFSGRMLVGATNYTGEVTTADIDRDGDTDVISADFNVDTITLHKNNGSGTFTSTVLTSGFDGARDVEVGDLDSDGLPDLVACSQNTTVNFGWMKNLGNGNFSAPTYIPVTFYRVTNVAIADLDLDGDQDLLASAGSSPVGNANRVCWFENTGGGTFSSERLVANNLTNSNFVGYADVDSDGDRDVIYTANDASRVGWSKNLTHHRSFVYATSNGAGSGGTGGPGKCAMGDFDGDGKLDVAVLLTSNIKIFRHHPDFIASQVNGPNTAADAIATGDIDRDGDADIVLVHKSANSVVWLENDNPGSLSIATWPARTIRSIPSPLCVKLHDMDGDGYLDVVVGSGTELAGQVAWYRNNQNPAEAGASHWATQMSHNAQIEGITDVDAEDVNQDGKPEMVVSAAAAGNIRMFSSEGSDNWTVASSLGAVKAFCIGDINGDGTQDIVAQSTPDNNLRAYLTTITGTAPSWTPVEVGNYNYGVMDVQCTDVDLDGDRDVAALYDLGYTKFYANNGDGSGFASYQSQWAVVPGSLAFGDIGGDAMPDLANAGQNTFWMFRNAGGQAALATEATAPGTLGAGNEEDFLKITGVHLGRTGDAAVEFGSLKLQLKNGSGTALTPAKAQALIEEISVYADTDGNGSWSAATDEKVATSISPVPDGSGNVILALPDGHPALQVQLGPGEKVLFVTIRSTDTAGSEPDNTVQIMHVTRSGSVMEDPRNNGPLLLQYAANTSAGGVPLPVSLSGFTVE